MVQLSSSSAQLGHIVLLLGSSTAQLGHVLVLLGSSVVQLGYVVARLGSLAAQLGHIVVQLGSLVSRLGHVVVQRGNSAAQLGHAVVQLGSLHLASQLGNYFSVHLFLSRSCPLVQLGPSILVQIGQWFLGLCGLLIFHKYDLVDWYSTSQQPQV